MDSMGTVAMSSTCHKTAPPSPTPCLGYPVNLMWSLLGKKESPTLIMIFVVLCALQWFLANNKYYYSVRINPEALAMLLEDGDLSVLYSITLSSTKEEQNHSPHRRKMKTPATFWPQHCSADDRARDHQTVSTRLTVLSATSSCTYSLVPCQQLANRQLQRRKNTERPA